jgi:hypothetical protein
MNDLDINHVVTYDDELTEPDVCFGSVCVVTWHPVLAVPTNFGFQIS